MDGLIIINKEKGFTSHDVVAKMRGILKMKKIGHTGTLDPDAEGVLPICVGKGTKVSGILTDSDKEYRAVLRLGVNTDTYDSSGTVLDTRDVNVTDEEIREVVNTFIGNIKQLPPMYSAIKINGKKLYEYARAGETVELKERDVTIHDILIEDIALPYITMTVKCSKGTYIRSLCHDIGEALHTYGIMDSLVRTRAAGFTLDDALKLSELENMVRDNKEIPLIPVDRVFEEYEPMIVKEAFHVMALNGNSLSKEHVDCANKSKYYRVYKDSLMQSFIGLYEDKGTYYKPYKMFI